MRIGLITGEYPPLQGGIGNHVDILSRHLQAQGHDVYVFSTSNTSQQTPDIPLTNTLQRWNWQIFNAISSWIVDYQLEVVDLHFQTAAFAMSPWVHFLPARITVPFVTTFHDLRFPYLFPKAGALRDWIVMHMARTSDGVIATNHEDALRLKALRHAMIPLGSNIRITPIDEPVSWRKQLGVSDDQFVLAYFGFINHSKGVDTLLQALALLNDPHIRLLMIGGRTGASDPTNIKYAEYIEQLVDELSIADRLIWTGYVDEGTVSAYLQIVDAVVLPFRDGASFRRGTLMASIEHACAIITTQPALSVPEFENGSLILVPPDDPSRLVDAIINLQNQPDLRQQLRQQVAELRYRFNWETVAKQVSTFYHRVIEETA